MNHGEKKCWYRSIRNTFIKNIAASLSLRFILLNFTQHEDKIADGKTYQLQSKKKIDIETFSEQLTINDVTTAIEARSNGIKTFNKEGKFLSVIDSVTTTIPHSNEATKKLEEMERHYNIILVQQVIFWQLI